jgi:hypothetical protein
MEFIEESIYCSDVDPAVLRRYSRCISTAMWAFHYQRARVSSYPVIVKLCVNNCGGAVGFLLLLNRVEHGKFEV